MTSITTRIRSIVGFWGTAALFFVIIFGALNLPAYSKLMGAVLGADDTPAISQTVLGETTPPPTKKTQQTAAPLTAKQIQGAAYVPKLTLAISPPDDRIIIPDLKIHAPIHEAQVPLTDASNWTDIENSIEDELHYGTVHFPGTAPLGGAGNALVTGHSSYYPWDNGHYKDIFATLPTIQPGDDVIIWTGGNKYTYQIQSTDIVTPTKTDILGQATTDHRLTLMTCYPVGTTLKRFIAVGELVPNEGDG